MSKGGEKEMKKGEGGERKERKAGEKRKEKRGRKKRKKPRKKKKKNGPLRCFELTQDECDGHRSGVQSVSSLVNHMPIWRKIGLLYQ